MTLMHHSRMAMYTRSACLADHRSPLAHTGDRRAAVSNASMIMAESKARSGL